MYTCGAIYLANALEVHLLRRVLRRPRLWSPSHVQYFLSFWSVVAVMRRVSEATGVRTGHVRKQASQAYAEEGLTCRGNILGNIVGITLLL